MRRVCVYRIRVGGKSYIGVSNNPKRRLRDHMKADTLIGRALRKYGDQTLEILAEFDTKEEAFQREIQEIEKGNTIRPGGWNVARGGSGIVEPDEEERKRRSERMKRLNQQDPGLAKRANASRTAEGEAKRRAASSENLKRLNRDPTFRKASSERMRRYNEHRHLERVV